MATLICNASDINQASCVPSPGGFTGAWYIETKDIDFDTVVFDGSLITDLALVGAASWKIMQTVQGGKSSFKETQEDRGTDPMKPISFMPEVTGKFKVVDEDFLAAINNGVPCCQYTVVIQGNDGKRRLFGFQDRGDGVAENILQGMIMTAVTEGGDIEGVIDATVTFKGRSQKAHYILDISVSMPALYN